MAVCRSCGAEITWTVTDSGKLMPVDADPSEDGNLVIANVPIGMTVLSHVETLFDADGPRYLSHFATCPEAREWRHG